MPAIFPSSGSLSLSQIQKFHGGSNPISLSEYYTGGLYVLEGTPTSNTISVADFFGDVTKYKSIDNRTVSGTFNVPIGINRIFVVLVGGLGGTGGDYIRYETPGDRLEAVVYATGGVGGYGGLMMAYQDVTPGEEIIFTVGARGVNGISGGVATPGGDGGSSTFNGLTATGGAGGGEASGSPGSGDKDPINTNGTTGANGSFSGTNYVTAFGSDVTNSGWVTQYNNLLALFIGTTAISSITTVRNQVARRTNPTLWTATGTVRPGCHDGAILIYY